LKEKQNGVMPEKIKIKTDFGTFAVYPCPFCGNDKLYVGHESSTNMEVKCFWYDGNEEFQGCGASVARHMFPNHELDDDERSTVNSPKNAFESK